MALTRVQYRLGHGAISPGLFEDLRLLSQTVDALPRLTSNNSETIRVALRLLHRATREPSWVLRKAGESDRSPSSSGGPISARGAEVEPESKEVQLGVEDALRLRDIESQRADFAGRPAAVIRGALNFLWEIARGLSDGWRLYRIDTAGEAHPIALREGAGNPQPETSHAKRGAGFMFRTRKLKDPIGFPGLFQASRG